MRLKDLGSKIATVVLVGGICLCVWYTYHVGEITKTESLFSCTVTNREVIDYSSSYRIYKVEMTSFDGELFSFEGFSVYDDYTLGEEVWVKVRKTYTQKGELLTTGYSVSKKK